MCMFTSSFAVSIKNVYADYTNACYVHCVHNSSAQKPLHSNPFRINTLNMKRLINWINNKSSSNEHSLHNNADSSSSSSFSYLILSIKVGHVLNVIWISNINNNNNEKENIIIVSSNLFCRLQKCAVWPLSDIFNKFNWIKRTKCYNATMYGFTWFGYMQYCTFKWLIHWRI